MTVATARELRNRVAAKFGKRSDVLSFPEHIVLYEVPFTGRVKPMYADVQDPRPHMFSRQRYDCLAIGVWPSSQRLVHGFELKVSRSDLLHELRDLTKSTVAASNVDRFWLVVGDRSIIKDTDEIPASWGILAAVGRGLRTVRQPEPQSGLMARELLIGVATRALVTPRIGTEVRYRDGLIMGQKYGTGDIAALRAQLTTARQDRDLAYQRGVEHGRSLAAIDPGWAPTGSEAGRG